MTIGRREKTVIKGEETIAQKGCGKGGLCPRLYLQGFKWVAEEVIIVVILPQLMKQKSTCGFRNSGTKPTGAQHEKQLASGPDQG